MLLWAVLFKVILQLLSSGTIWISSIKDIQNDIRTVNNFVKLLPNSSTKALIEDLMSTSVSLILYFMLVQILVGNGVISLLFLFNILDHRVKIGNSYVRSLSLLFRAESVTKTFDLE